MELDQTIEALRRCRRYERTEYNVVYCYWIQDDDGRLGEGFFCLDRDYTEVRALSSQFTGEEMRWLRELGHLTGPPAIQFGAYQR